MLTLNTIKECIQMLGVQFDHYYISAMDANKENALGVYHLKRGTGHADIALGGMANTKIRTKSVSLLIHWNKSSTQTESQAIRLFEALMNLNNLTPLPIFNYTVDYVHMLVPEPVFVGRDDNGIVEYVIEVEFYYREN